MFKSRFWKNFDWILFGIAMLLVVFGLIIIYSTSFKAAFHVAPADVRNQVLFAVVSLVALFVVAKTDYRMWGKLTTWMYLGSIALLVIVSITGKTALGATRWINLGFFQLQPSEICKMVLIIVLAKFFADHYDQMDQPRYLIQSLVYMLVPFFLVLMQPDLGTALLFIWLIMVLTTKVPKTYLVALAVAGLALLPLATKFLKPYQRQRLTTFLNPTANPLGSGYNVVQSTIAVGSGQWLGRGLAAGSQSQLNFLPSQHTDFIFAVLAEKLGFVGAILLLGLFLALLLRGLQISWRARERFGMFLALGIVGMLLFHLFINIGMNIGLLPVAGIPLPFISYGGTSLLVSLVGIGLLESIAARRKKIEFGT
jgi:rod shape determining protein RodA